MTEQLGSVGTTLMRFNDMSLWNLVHLIKRTGTSRMQFGVPNTLSGYFELRVDRIVGWARDAYGSRVAGMQIEILFRNSVIASFAADPHPEFGRFDFSYPVLGRFTGAELVKEDIIVIARDSDGNSGRLLLDGAAQIELIREHLGVPCVVELDLDFSRGGNASPYLGAGWSGADADFTFTENDNSFVSFDTPTEPGAYALRITAGALVRKPDLPGQELVIFVNERQVAYIFYNEGHVQFQECKFSHEAFGDETRTTARLHHPDAARPVDLGVNKDTRRLAFSFKRLTLVRLLQTG